MKAAFPESLLVVRLGAIGDVVNALVFATAVKETHPDTRIGWAVHELAQPLVTGHSSVDQIHLWRRGEGPGAFTRVLREVRSARYEMAVDLQRILKSACLARLSGAQRVLGFHRSASKEASWLWTTERIAASLASTHMVDRYMGFARHLGIESAPVHRLPRDPAAEAWAEELVSRLGSAPLLVNLGASKPSNRWPAERFGALALELQRQFDVPVLLTGGALERSAEKAALGVLPRGHKVHSTVGETDLMQLLSLERRAKLFIGCDTGPMHMAVAVGTPTLALFGPADPRRTGPFGALDQAGKPIDGAPHRVVRVPPDCAPCHRKTCNLPVHACMENIQVEQVLITCGQMLASSASISATEASR